ncbi:3'-5' exonuclease [Chromohalobacter nigrandesensis]|uniref:3'-5' exonuclease n=1 Tax=Chromohalobacter nigrandesensis TaxID=119863 RepID=UPI001FF3A05A|nr:3'-5' exonuclease [Chromohalobacter nigrandesensis]MCK0744455.1 3'-5' exonuclease [Chromohalobacter nigrandesensis]
MIKALRRAGDRRRQLGGHHAWRFAPYGGSEVIALDCETTDLDPRRAELVALAAVKVRDGRVLTSESLDLRLQRPESLSGDSIRIHGLRGVDLLGGEALGDALERLLDFIGNRPLVGWCIAYDVAVINRHLRPRTGFDLPNRTLDVCKLYARERRRVQPDIEPDMRFEVMSEALGVPVIGRHTALGDAVTTALMYLRLCHGRALSA